MLAKTPACVELSNLLLAKAPSALARSAITAKSTSLSATVALGLLTANSDEGAEGGEGSEATAVAKVSVDGDGSMIVDVDHLWMGLETRYLQLRLERPEPGAIASPSAVRRATTGRLDATAGAQSLRRDKSARSAAAV